MVDEPAHFRLRLPADLKAKIEAAAVAERRTINAEVVARLQRSFVDYLNLSGQGLEQILKQASAAASTLWEMMTFQRDVDLDGYIADEAKAGRVMSRSEATAHILREYLSERGYVYEPPQRRPDLLGWGAGSGFEKFADYFGGERVIVRREDDVGAVWKALDDAAKVAVQEALRSLEASGTIKLAHESSAPSVPPSSTPTGVKSKKARK